MSQPTHYLKTQQLADALGIGVSTVKRWVDAGEIAATRTLGGHRLIATDDAIRFARSRKLATANLEGLTGSSDLISERIEGEFVDALLAVLKEGQAREAKEMIVSAYQELGSAAALTDVLGAVMYRIGHGWSIGTWDVYEEHQASLIVSSVISEQIVQRNQNGLLAPLAIGAGLEGDLCTLGLLLGELTLREVGWNVKNLGPNLPLRSLARAIRLLHPRLIFVSVSHLLDPIAFLKNFPELLGAAHAEQATIVMGGKGLLPEVSSQLDDVQIGDRMAFLESVGRELLRSIQSLDS